MTQAPIDTLSFTLANRKWHIYKPADLETLWEEMGPEDFADERIPYWTEIWPASLGLGLWLTNQNLRGKTCLDLGCGLGLTALIAAQVNTNVLACDYEITALKIARKNAKLNNIKAPMFFLMDWRRPCIKPKSLDIIWAADVIYEKRSFKPVLSFLKHSLKHDGVAWIAEPGRSLFQQFLLLAKEQNWHIEPIWRKSITPLQPKPESLEVTIWQLSPPKA